MLTLYDDKTIGNKEYIKDIEASFAFYKDAIVMGQFRCVASIPTNSATQEVFLIFKK